MTTTLKTFDVYRSENRASGRTDHLGTVEAPDEAAAIFEAQAQFGDECRTTQHLYVSEQIDE